MKKNLISCLVLTLLFSVPGICFAEGVKTITLTNGTVVKGEVLKFEDSVYTIKTANLGTLEINDGDVVSISIEGASKGDTANAANLQGQVAAMQANFLNDPDVMEDIQKLMEDPEILGIVSDPNFIGTIKSYDQEKIENDPRTNALLENPNMKKLIEKMSDKMNQ